MPWNFLDVVSLGEIREIVTPAFLIIFNPCQKFIYFVS